MSVSQFLSPWGFPEWEHMCWLNQTECQAVLVTPATVTISWPMWSGGLSNGLLVGGNTPLGKGVVYKALCSAQPPYCSGGRGGDHGRVGIGWGRIEGQEWGPWVEHIHPEDLVCILNSSHYVCGGSAERDQVCPESVYSSLGHM